MCHAEQRPRYCYILLTRTHTAHHAIYNLYTTVDTVDISTVDISTVDISTEYTEGNIRVKRRRAANQRALVAARTR